MEDITLTVIQNLKQAESKNQMLDIVSWNLRKLTKKFEDRIFITLKPALEYKQDKNTRDEIIFIKEGLEGKWKTEIENTRLGFLKQQVEDVLNMCA